MIAVAQPKLSSKENRKRIKAARAAGLASSRSIHRRIADEQAALSEPRLKGTPSNSEIKQADGARLARERKARKKAQRLAARPRVIVTQEVKKPLPGSVTVTMLVEA